MREVGQRLKQRMDQGFKFLKMDVGIGLLRGIPDALIAPPGMLDSRDIMHPFTGIQITDKGIGNGISLIIMIGIIARMPQSLGIEFLSRLEQQEQIVAATAELLEVLSAQVEGR